MGKIVKTLSCLLAILITALTVTPVMAQTEADLQPTDIGVTTLYAGVSNRITVTVANNTNVAVASFNVVLQANGDNISTLNGAISGNADPYYWPAMFNFNWTPPSSGNVTLTAIVDPANNVVETSEGNNQLAKMVTVTDLAPVTVKVRVEGKNANIWSGEVTFATSNISDQDGPHYIDHPTALGTLDAAAQAGSFGYVVTNAYGPLSFIESVAGEVNVGLDGWMYRVNWLSPNVGAVDYSVGEGDEVLWYYGGFDPVTWAPSKPIKLSVDKNVLAVTENFTVTVQASNEVSWSPVSGATVYIASQNFTTDANGQVKGISLSSGNYTVSASKGTYAEFTRSNREKVMVVAPVNVSLNAPEVVYSGFYFTATLNISQVIDFDAVNYTVTFNPAVLRLDNVTAGEIGGALIPVAAYSDEPERATGNCTIVQNVPGLPGVTGSGSLARLHFYVVGSPGDNTTISLSEGALSNVMANRIPAVWTGDLITVAVAQQGDVNGDGYVDAVDVTKLERIIVRLDPMTAGANVNQDGQVDAVDITKLERIIAKLP